MLFLPPSHTTRAHTTTMPHRTSLRLLLTCLLISTPLPDTSRADDAKDQYFRSTIEPILQQHCYHCHSHSSGSMESGLTLDWASGWQTGGSRGPAIIPGKPDDSLLIQAVRHTRPELLMPADKLSAAEIRSLEDWVRDGAHDPRSTAPEKHTISTDWWSWRPLLRPAVPTPPARTDNSSTTPLNPIDAFLLAELDSRKLEPAPLADRRTLIRRLTMDLHGLLPTSEQIAAFEADQQPAAMSRLVDSLLQSPRYGERWARHWMDAVHFADSHGFEHDVFRPAAWPYRDYLIDRFNQDVPWDRMIREQLAADVFFPTDTSLTPALGFLGAGTYDHSAAATAPKNFENLDRDDLVNQTMSAFTSTTVSCARCHDHKFDPISQADYYSLQAVFAGIGKGEISYDADPKIAAERQHWQRLLTAATDRNTAVLSEPAQTQLTSDWEQQQGQPATWTPLRLQSFVSVDAAELSLLEDGSILSSGPCPDAETTVVSGNTTLPQITALRLDVLTHESLPNNGPGRAANGNLHLNEVELRLFRPGSPNPERLNIRRASADFSQEGWNIQQAIDGNLQTAWGIHPQEAQPHFAVFELAQPVSLTPDCSIHVLLRQIHGRKHIIGRLKLTVTDAAGDLTLAIPPEIADIQRLPAEQRSPAQRLSLTAFAVNRIASARLAALPAPQKLYAAATVAQNERGTIRYDKPRDIHILTRGDVDRPGIPVQPGALSAIPELSGHFELPPEHPESARRAALAEWLADTRNPLTWRSLANRLWQHHFGRGLCETSGDFGRMGSTPEHPLLLDWLACELRETRSLKHLHRLICTSHAWARSGNTPTRLHEQDPENRLLATRTPRRMDADSWRDCVLQASGQLDLTMGGPGVAYFSTRPGAQLTPILNYSDFNWDTPGAGRRSIYRVVWRGIADPLLEPLDFPDLGLLAPVRGESLSPLQTLTLLNNRFVLHHAEKMAEQTTQQGTTPEEQVRAAVLRTWQRQPDEIELQTLSTLARDHGLAAVCRLLLNSSEFLYID